MKIVIAIDSFKGSLSSYEAGASAREGIIRVFPDSEVVVLPIADGGEGTTDALISAMNGEKVTAHVTGPLGETVEASYGLIPDTSAAVIEMASAAGLPLVPHGLRDPMKTTTYGVGELICDAVGRGCRNFIVGIGGSATNDGGIGMLSALGYGFLDGNGDPVKYGAEGLSSLAYIDTSGALPELSECTFHVACDVTNPLCGSLGCTYVFSPQKGARAEDLPLMDRWMERYARLCLDVFPEADKSFPGAGAAGGIGYAFKTFLGATLAPGVETVLRATGFYRALEGADLVITGEGRLDSQTVMGKAPAGVAEAAKDRNIPVIAFAGCVAPDATECNYRGIDAFFPILRRVVTESEAMDKNTASASLADTVEQVMRLIKTLGTY